MDPPRLSFQYQDPNSLLVINPKGKIKRLFTPFRVKCSSPSVDFPLNAWVKVDELSFTQQEPLLYRINGIWYSYQHFAVLINF